MLPAQPILLVPPHAGVERQIELGLTLGRQFTNLDTQFGLFIGIEEAHTTSALPMSCHIANRVLCEFAIPNSDAVAKREQGSIAVARGWRPIPLFELLFDLLWRYGLRWSRTEPLQRYGQAVFIVTVAALMAARVRERILGNLPERHWCAPQFFGKLAAFEHLCFALSVEPNGRTLGAGLFAVALAKLVKPADPPDIRVRYPFVDSPVFHFRVSFLCALESSLP